MPEPIASETGAAAPAVLPETELLVDLDGFEGPISLLLVLAREQKVDLTRISILELADQYIRFIETAHRLRLELAADYLVMAAWLAYLKSRLLLPDPPPDDEPTGAELAESLHFRLRRLEAMQEAARGLIARPMLGRDVFRRGRPEGLRLVVRPQFAVGLHELLGAYGAQHARGAVPVLHIRARSYYSVDDALQHLSRTLGQGLDWRRLEAFLPPQLAHGLLGRRSALAATFVAALELAKSGVLELRQDEPFAPLLLRAIPSKLPRSQS